MISFAFLAEGEEYSGTQLLAAATLENQLVRHPYSILRARSFGVALVMSLYANLLGLELLRVDRRAPFLSFRGLPYASCRLTCQTPLERHAPFPPWNYTARHP